MEECEESVDDDGEWYCDSPQDAAFFVNLEQIDQIIAKLQEARSFLREH